VSVVQTLPSLQLAVGWPHWPVMGSQVSWVQGLESSQLWDVPWQAIAPPASGAQVSPLVHRFPSSQEAPAANDVPKQCPEASQESETVQLLPSSHDEFGCRWFPLHCPLALQASFCVQELPSVHEVPAATFEWTQTPILLARLVHASVVQGFPSSQLRGSCRQKPVPVSQESMVQKLKSSQEGQSMAAAGGTKTTRANRQAVQHTKSRARE
jgi:hypothetical protein